MPGQHDLPSLCALLPYSKQQRRSLIPLLGFGLLTLIYKNLDDIADRLRKAHTNVQLSERNSGLPEP
jgi:hypothetical protein